MSVNIDSFINSFVSKSQNTKLPTNNSAKYVQQDNIFAAAKGLVADYKAKQNSETETKKSGLTAGMTISQVANMSTSQFLNYAYDNKAKSGFTEGEDKDTGIKLPSLISYDGMVISTAGKSLMQIVAKIKGKYNYLSEEKIASRLISQYATEEQIEKLNKKYASTGSNLNMSA